MKRGNKPYSVTFESLVMRLVKHVPLFVFTSVNRPKRLLLSFDVKLAFILFRVTYLFVVCIGLCLFLFQQGWPKRILFLVGYSLVVCIYFNLFSI